MSDNTTITFNVAMVCIAIVLVASQCSDSIVQRDRCEARLEALMGQRK